MSNDEEEGDNNPFVANKLLLTQDKRVPTSLYTADIWGINVVIAIGKVNTLVLGSKYQFPIYLVTKNKQVFRIGNYNVDNKKAFNKEDKTLKSVKYLKKVEPTLFDFVTKEMIQRNGIIDYEEPLGASEDNPAELMVSKSASAPASASRPEATSSQSLFENIAPTTVTPNNSNQWIQAFMHTSKNEYQIYNVNDNGDCLYEAIMYAYMSIGKKTTVKKLRGVVADNFPQHQYDTYKEMYDKNIAQLREDEQKINENNATCKHILNDLKNLSSPIKRQQIDKVNKFRTKINKLYIARGDAIDDGVYDLNESDVEIEEATIKYTKAYNELLSVDSNDVGVIRIKELQDEIVERYKNMDDVKTLQRNFKHMGDISSLADLQQKIKTTNMWADEASIKILESKLNMQLITIESTNPPGMLCSHGTPNGDLKPDYYIILEHTGSHYKLITYKNKAIFTFNDLPQKIKQKVIDRCMKNQRDGSWLTDGLFWRIPDFRDMANGQKQAQARAQEER
jgi:hypothetical protein